MVVDNRGPATSIKASMTDRLVETLRSHFDVEVVPSAPLRQHHDFSRVNFIILSGSEYHLPRDLHKVPFALQAVRWAQKTRTPVLGICFGMQLLAHMLGGKVSPRQDDSPVAYLARDRFIQDPVYFNHKDSVVVMPPRCHGQCIPSLAPAFAHLVGEGVLGLQWHPEGTDHGKQWLIRYLTDYHTKNR